MKQQDIIQLIKNPHSVSMADMDELNVFTQEFPFFQTAQLLYTIGVKSNSPQHYQKQLRKTAVIANNRTVLYELLHPGVNKTVKPVEHSIVEPVEQEQKTDTSATHVNTTNESVKVVYITSTIEKPQQQLNSQSELEILKDIENDTSDSKPAFDEEKLNREIEREISKQLIDSYVQTEIIRTPELHDKPEKIEEEDPNENITLDIQPGSFMDWLQKVKRPEVINQEVTEKPKTEPQIPANEQKVAGDLKIEEKKKLIDKIIESDPGKIRMSKDKFFSATQDAKQSLLENEHLITETLAKIYALQGNISKAIRAYEILSLKFPQKSVYFASLIEKLKTK